MKGGLVKGSVTYRCLEGRREVGKGGKEGCVGFQDVRLTGVNYKDGRDDNSLFAENTYLLPVIHTLV